MGNEEGPKLYTTKPKKTAQSKQHHKAKNFSTPAPNPTSTAMDPTPPPSSSSGAPPPLKESFARRYKFVWPVLLTVNLAIGGYLFLRTNKKDKKEEDGEVAEDVPFTPPANTTTSTPAASTTTTAPVPVKSVTPVLTEPVKVRKPILEDEQRELFKWVLEEKRKVIPKDPEEKKRLDEEKAILKQFIRAKSIPSL